MTSILYVVTEVEETPENDPIIKNWVFTTEEAANTHMQMLKQDHEQAYQEWSNTGDDEKWDKGFPDKIVRMHPVELDNSCR